MHKIVVAAWAALALLSLPAAAVNKCTAPDGSVAFQDAPCAGKGEAVVVRPASGSGGLAPGGVSEAQRINAAIDRSAAARRVVELDALLIPRATQALQRHQLRCTQQRAELERSQYAYRQNLYGKTHAAQMASEMVQLTLDCEREEKALLRTLRTLEQERSAAAGAAN
ncbi:MAG: hypothetical protein Q7U52_11720 [Hydrogenophaga sp.]|nr:hypothetical protein [Hydrogenophaga sp.]